MKNLTKHWIKLVLVYNIVCIIIAFLFYFFKLVPTLLCYPPNSIDNDFQVIINGLTYTQQYIMIVFSSIVVENIILIYSLKKTNNLRLKLINCSKSDSSKSYYELSKSILKIPKLIYVIQVIVPIIMIAITFSLLKGDLFITLKVCLLFFSMLTLIASIAYIFSKKTFQNILVDIYYELANYADIDSNFNNYVKRTSIKDIIFVVTIPMFVVTAILIALSGYASVINETGDLTYVFYNQQLNTLSIPTTSADPINDLSRILGNLNYRKDLDAFFIISPHNQIITSNNEGLSEFFTTYLDQLSATQPEKNRVYDFYGDDSQGVFRVVNINGEEWTIGVRYNLVSTDVLIGLLSMFIILFITNIIVLRYFANYLMGELKRISDALLNIAKENNIDSNKKLPVVSNDEMGDLVNAFNEIQHLTKSNIDQIHKNQNMLMERERLASLGQLIGGIAHNLKTPIMSISGAAEGLTDLIKEYDASIGDPDVTFADHHAIAKDMYEWVSKIKSYSEYMSDVITAVKGQAVTLSENESTAFDIDELVKRINILMKHELKNALVTLNVDIRIDKSTTLNGDITSLVQVINNMISNSIQAYNGKPNQEIDLIIDKRENNIVISVKDYGTGLPDSVKDKLFKEMITTKGKNGTGLGLFMSYSTIKAHFNGNITFETEKDKGTTFNIIIPM